MLCWLVEKHCIVFHGMISAVSHQQRVFWRRSQIFWLEIDRNGGTLKLDYQHEVYILIVIVITIIIIIIIVIIIALFVMIFITMIIE